MPSLIYAALDQLIIPVIHYSSQPSILCEFYQLDVTARVSEVKLNNVPVSFGSM